MRKISPLILSANRHPTCNWFCIIYSVFPAPSSRLSMVLTTGWVPPGGIQSHTPPGSLQPSYNIHEMPGNRTKYSQPPPRATPSHHLPILQLKEMSPYSIEKMIICRRSFVKLLITIGEMLIKR